MMADVVFLREDCCELVENMAAYADIEKVRPRKRCDVVYVVNYWTESNYILGRTLRY